MATTRTRGEASALRNPVLGSLTDSLWTYQLNSSHVDYALARALYGNEVDKYKLAAGFARKIIGAKVAFTDQPQWKHADPEAEAELAQLLDDWSAAIWLLVRDTYLLGDAYARLELQADPLGFRPDSLHLRTVPPEWVIPERDPISGTLEAVTIRHPIWTQSGPNGRTGMPSLNTVAYVLVERLTRTTRTIEVDDTQGLAPPEVVDRYTGFSEPNRWGFVPIVHFRNEPEDTAVFGSSELEPLEPYFRAYHDVLFSAVEGVPTYSRPKTKIFVRDTLAFLRNNFTPTEVQTILGGGRVSVRGREHFILARDMDGSGRDDVEVINPPSGGPQAATAVLEYIFLCILETSEVPEFVFGNAIASSRASVTEQLLPFVRSIVGKREMLTEPFRDLGDMALVMSGNASRGRLESGVRVEWSDVSPRDEAQSAQTIERLVNAFTRAVPAGLVSLEAAVDFLKGYIDTMQAFSEPDAASDEERRIQDGLAVLEATSVTPVSTAGALAGRRSSPSQQAVDALLGQLRTNGATAR